MGYDFECLIAEIVDAVYNGAKVSILVAGEKVPVVKARSHGRDHNLVRIENTFGDELVIHGAHIQAVVIKTS